MQDSARECSSNCALMSIYSLVDMLNYLHVNHPHTRMTEVQSRLPLTEDTRLRWLQLAMRVFGAAFVGLTAFLGVALVLDLSLVGNGSFLEWYFFWHPRNLSYELMVGAMLGAWGLFLWRAASNPLEHRFFIDFSIVFLGLHALVMAYTALVVEGALHHFLTDVAFLGVLAVVFLVLRPPKNGN